MSHTLSQLLSFIEENDTKFIRLAFCDIFGVQKNIAIMASQLPHAVEKGVSFDASAIAGFSNVAESDLFLVPDLDTFSLLPWRPSESCVGRFFCNIRYRTAGLLKEMAATFCVRWSRRLHRRDIASFWGRSANFISLRPMSGAAPH